MSWILQLNELLWLLYWYSREVKERAISITCCMVIVTGKGPFFSQHIAGGPACSVPLPASPQAPSHTACTVYMHTSNCILSSPSVCDALLLWWLLPTPLCFGRFCLKLSLPYNSRKQMALFTHNACL